MSWLAVLSVLGLLAAAPAAAVDLTVTEVSGPSRAKAGSGITVEAVVAASGRGEKVGPFRVGIYFSTDASITTADELIGSRTVRSLKEEKRHRTVTVPANIPNRSGSYYLGAIVDDLNAVPESNEDNNARTGDAITIKGPDLTVVAVSGPTSAAPGSSIRVSATVANANKGGEVEELLVGIYLSGDQVISTTDLFLGRLEFEEVEGGKPRTRTTTVTLPAGLTGSFYLGAIADYRGRIAETDESNNARAGNAIVIAGPDLAILGTSGPAWAMPGSPALFSADVAAGPAGSPGGRWFVDFYLQGGAAPVTADPARWLGRYTGLAPLAAHEGATASIEGTVPASLGPGSWYLGAIVSSEGADSVPGNDALATGQIDVSRILSGVSDGDLRAAVPATVDYRQDIPGAAHVAATLDAAPFQGPLSVSAEGDHVAVATVYDVLGNVLGQETIHFAIDLSAPVIQVSGLNDGQVTAAAAVTPLFSASDPHLASVSATLDGLPIASGDAVTAEGEHDLIVTANDTLGHSSTRTVHFAIDRTPPVVSVTGVAPGQLSPPPVVPVFAASDAHLVEVTATLDAGPFLSGTPVASAGPHLLVVRATDGAALVTEVAIPFTVAGDTAAPEIVVSGVTPGEVTSRSPVDVCVVVSDQNLASWSATLDGLGVPACFSVHLEGDHELVVTAQDTFGNSSSKVVGFALDFTAPQLVITGVADGQVVDAPAVLVTYAMVDAHPASLGATMNGAPFANGEAVTGEGEYQLAVTGTDRAGQATQQAWHFTIDRTAPVVTVAGVTDQQVSRLPLTPVVSASDLTLATLTAMLDGQPFVSGTPVASEGVHELLVTATDRAGHSVTVAVRFRIDTIAPAVVVVAPTDASLLATVTAAVVVNATDAGGLASVTANGAALGLAADGLWRGTVALIEGANTLLVVATDRAGNSATASASFERDTTLPQLAVTSPAEGALLGSATVSVSGTVTDAHPVKVTANGIPATLAGGVFTASVTLAEGPQSVTFVATDAAGNATTQVTHLTVDLTAPVIDVAGAADGEATNAASVILGYGATDANLESVSATLDGIDFASGSSVTAEGPHRLEVSARDRAGHVSTRIVSFLIDRTRPVVTVTGVFDGLVTQVAITPVVQANDPYLASVTITLDGLPFSSGTPVAAEGTHTLVVAASDLAQNVQEVTIGFTILRDVTPPAITVAGVTDGEVTARSAVDVTIEVSDPNLVSWSATLDGTTVPAVFSVYLEGDHELVVVASDSKGNTTTRTVRFGLDFTPPAIAVGGVSDGQVTNLASLVVSYTVGDLHPGEVHATLDGTSFQGSLEVTAEGAHYLEVVAWDLAGNPRTVGLRFSIDRTPPVVTIAGVAEGLVVRPPVSPTYQAADLNPGTISATLDGLAFASGAAVTAEGVHHLVATATDLAGNPGSASVSFRVDATPPSLTVSAPLPGSMVGGADVAVVASASDVGGVGGLTANGIVLAPGADGSWHGRVPLVEGPDSVVVIAMDVAGNPAQVTVPVVRDTVPPTLTLTSPAEGAVLASGSVTVAGTVSDTAAVSLTVDGVAVPVASGGFSTVVTLAEGPQVIEVTASDAVGNASPRTVRVTVDLTDPSIDVVGVVEGQLSNAPALTVSYSATDTNLESVTATLDGVAFASGAAATAEGPHELVVTARDRAGRTATRITHFVLDRTAPAVTIGSPASGLLLAQSAVEVAAQVDELRDLAAVSANGSVLGKGLDGVWRGTVSLAEGSNSITVAALDGAGNTGSASVAVTRDTTRPTLNLTSPAEGQIFQSGDVVVAGTASDAGGVAVTVDGSVVAVAADGTFQVPLSLPYGDRTITVIARDPAGNLEIQVRRVQVRGGPMQVTVVEPRSGFVTSGTSVTVRGVVSGGVGGWSATVNGSPVSVASDGSYSGSVPLAVGAATITVVATDAAGASATASVSGRRSDAGGTPPEPGAGDPVVTLDSPASGSIFGGAVPINGSISGGTPPYQASALGVPLSVSGTYFASSLELAEGDQVLSVQVVDAAGRQAAVQRSVSVDRTAPYLQVTRPLTSPAEANESPYLVQGTVGDVHLSSVTVGGLAATVVGGQFAVPVPLTAGINTVEVVAQDVVGNVSRRSLELSVRALPPTVTILSPLDGSQSATATTTVQARVEATSPIQSVTIGTGAAREEGGQWVAEVALALGDNSITVTATDAGGLTGSAVVRVKYRDVSQEPLAVTGIDPVPGAASVEPSALVSVAFNKPIVRDSVPGHFTVTAAGAPVAGGFYIAPGDQTVSFVARQPLPDGARVEVSVSGVAATAGPGMASAFQSQFTVRTRQTQLYGSVVDEQLRPLPNVLVSVEGTGVSTRTGPEGSWHLVGVPAGIVVLRFEGGSLGDGVSLPSLRRRVFVNGAADTHDDLLMMVPVDGASASMVDSRAAVHVGFGGRHEGLALDVPESGLFFEDGKTAGLLTASWIPSFALPVPVENGRFAGGSLWEVGPPGVRFTKPVDFTFPNATKLPPGRYVVVMAYDPDRHMLVRAGIAQVSADEATIRTLEPLNVQGLDFFGFSHVTDTQQAALSQLFNPASTPAAPAQGSGSGGTTGWLTPRDRGLPALLELLMLPLGGQSAQAWLGVGGPIGSYGAALGSGEPDPGYATIVGRVRTPQERMIQVDVPVGLADQSVDLPFQHRVSFKATADSSAASVQIALRATRGPSAISPPSDESWGQAPIIQGVGSAAVTGTVQLDTGTTLITAEAFQGADSRSARLEATVTDLPPQIDPTTGKSVRRGQLVVRRLIETEEPATSQGISFFSNWKVTVQGASRAEGVTSQTGAFQIPVFSYGNQDGAIACTDVQTGLRWIVQADASDPTAPRLARYPITEGFPICQTVWGVAPGSTSPVSLTVDMRLLTGSINFYNRDDKPVAGACDPAAETAWNDGTSELVSISGADVEKTEVYFFREDDLERPIARYTMAVPPTPGQCSASGPFHADYKRLRFGPSERWTRRDRETCEQMRLSGNTQDYFYRFTCEGRERQLGLRLSQGDHLLVVAVNHATGYAGAATVVVPGIATQVGLDANGKCAADDAANGPILVHEGGQTFQISRCAQQDLRIFADLRLYPPEVDVRVARQLTPAGTKMGSEVHLVRHGGGATVSDDLLYLSTQWRVRLPPPDLDSDGTPNSLDKCPNEAGPPDKDGCPDPARPDWTPPPRPPVVFEPPAPMPAGGVAQTGGVAWPYRYTGPRPGPAVDPFDADGDGIPDMLYDRDGDGVMDAADRCPTQPGTAADGGCPAGSGPTDPSNPDSDGDGIPDGIDVCPFFPGPTSPATTNGCPSLVSRFDTDGDGVSDTEDECLWAPGPASNHGCPDPNDPGWQPEPAPPAIPGGPGKVLERYCSELVAPTLEEIRICRRMEDRFMDMPAGVPPLAGHLIRVTGSAAEQPAVAVFPIMPGRHTGDVQAAVRIVNPSAPSPDPSVPPANQTISVNLPRANYYVHVVGNLTLFNDKNGDGRIDPITEIAVAPPAFQEPASGTGKPGLPEFAIPLKNVYRSLEPDGSQLERFDLDREHEFRVFETKLKSVTATTAGGTRRVDQLPGGSTDAWVEEGDLSYQMLLQLIAPGDPARATTMPGSFRARLGSDEFGIECGVVVTGGQLTATCDGAWLYDVLSARDVIYLGVSLAGNAENILYKFNLHGLSRRLDLVTAGHATTAAKSLAPDKSIDPTKYGVPETLRPISQAALVNVFLGPALFKNGRVRVCAGPCSGGGILRSFDATWKEGGSYTVAETGGVGAIEQVPNFGSGGASLFRLAVPPDKVEMPGRELLGLEPVMDLFVEYQDSSDNSAPWKSIAFGKPKGGFQGANARAPGQASTGGVNIADGHVSFSHEDLSLPEFAGRVRFARTYNNVDNEIGTLGIGWRHSFEGYVVEERLGRYSMVLEGQSYDFPTCTTVDVDKKSAEDCFTDGAHGGLLTVKMRPEVASASPRNEPDVVFVAPNGVRYRFDRWSQKSLQSASAAGEVLAANTAAAQAEYQKDTGAAGQVAAQLPRKRIREAGRRRWVLTAISDGHGRPDLADATRPGKGWSFVEYFADSDMVRRVYRRGGKLVLDFAYDQVDLGSSIPARFKAAAVTEGFAFLKSVSARFQGPAGTGDPPDATGGFIAQVTFNRTTDLRGNLASAERATTGPDLAWKYRYVSDLASLGTAGQRMGGQDLWEAANEIESAEQQVYGSVQSRTSWTRTLSWMGFPHQRRFEIVDQVVLPGTSDAGDTGIARDNKLTISWVSATARQITRPDGKLVDLELNAYGNVASETLAGTTLATNWYSTEEGKKVQPSDLVSQTGRTLHFESDDTHHWPTKLTLSAAGSSDSVPAAVRGGSAVGQVLREHRDHDLTYGIPRTTERATAGGTALSTRTVSAAGDVTSITLTEGTTTLSSWPSNAVDIEGVVTRIVDPVGRVTTWTDATNAWGLRPVSITTLGQAGTGGRPSVQRTLHHDWLGRVDRSSDDAGHVEEWDYDAVGRLRRHMIAGTPSQEWQYAYAQPSDRELTVTETLTGTGHQRVSRYLDGLLVSEAWRYGSANQEARRTWSYKAGRLDERVDELGTTWKHSYDLKGRLQQVVAVDPVTSGERPLVTYERDEEGRVFRETDQNGLVVKTGFDELGRPASWDKGARSMDGVVDTETVKLDPAGVPVSRTFGSFAWTYVVDGMGRVKVAQNGTAADQVNTETTYDALGRVTRVADKIMGLVETWKYDDVLGRQTEYLRTAEPLREEYRETRAYTDTVSNTGTEHRVEVVEHVNGQQAKRKNLWFDSAGRLLHSQEFVVRGATSLSNDRYFEYDPRGNLLSQREPVGDGPTSQAATVSDSTTAVSTHSYDPAGNLLATVDAGGHATAFGVNASGQVTAKTGPQSGEAWTFEYDVFGQLKTKALVRGATARAGWKGAVWSYEYGLADGPTVRETGPDGYTTSRWYNGRHQLLKELRSDVGATRSSSNEWTMAQVWDGPYLKSREEKEGAWVKTISRPRYDHRGRVLEETEAFVGVEGSAGYTYTTETPWSGRVARPVTQTWATQTKSGSRTGSLAVDGLGNTIEQAWGVYSDQWGYDAAGRLVSEKLSGKPERRLHYVEGLADLETYGPAASVETTSYRYWASGRPWIRSEPDGRERRLTWNERGLLAKEEYGRGGSYDTRQYGYDAAGQRSFMLVGLAPDESPWDYSNGPRGELLSVTQPGATGGTFQYEYDERAQLARVTPPAGSASAVLALDYDYMGRQVRKQRGDATWTTSWADGAGTTLEPTDPISGVSRTVYRSQDGRGREAVVSWSGVPSELTQVARQYGPHDGPLGVTEYRAGGNVEVVYGYDDRFLVTGVTRGAESVTYGYTASGERAWELSPGGRTDYDYDPLDRLWHATSTRGSTEFVWEAGGARLLDVKAPNLTECRRYDARGRLLWMDGRDPGAGCDSPAAAPIARFEYGYDERGNRTSETYNSQGVAESPTQYGYDAADRLTSVVSPSGAETTYDLLGDGSRNSVTTAVTQGGLRTTERYHYDARGGLTGITDDLNQPVATYQVDPAGHVLSETRAGRAKSFTWDAGGRLAAASVTVNGTTTASSFRYDHQGLRIWKQGPTGTTTYLWGAGELAEEVLPSGPRLRYERGAGLALAVGGETLLHDGLGSVVGRVGLGAPAMYRYDAWGNFQGTTAPTAAEPSLAYAGQHWDADVGLSYAQQRWYQPDTGRFLSEDPVFGDPGSPTSLHAFGYANGNPLAFTDPLGTTACVPSDPGSCFQEAEENNALCAGEPDELACRHRLAKAELKGGAIGLGLAAGVAGIALAPEVIATAPTIGAKGTAIVTASGAAASRWGQQALRLGQAAYNQASVTLARYGDRIAGWAQPVATCVDSVESGSVTGCVVAALTHGYQGHVGRSATVPTKTVGAEVEAGAPASTAQTYRVGEVTPNGRIAGLGPGAAAPFDATDARTWNEFQAQTRGMFSSRAEAGAAWKAVKAAQSGPVVIGETMARVEQAAGKIPGSKILNDMPDFAAMGMSEHQVTSAMMQYNRKWFLDQLRSGRPIVDIGPDPNRSIPSIFYPMEESMSKNYQKLHPEFGGVTKR